MPGDLPARLRSEGGNTLVLVPVAVLILLLLAAIAVDAAVVFLGQRRLADLAAGVARDAVAALDQERFYADQGDLAIDRGGAVRRERLAADRLPTDDAFRRPRCDVVVADERVEVACRAEVHLLFTPATGAGTRVREVRVIESAEARPG